MNQGKFIEWELAEGLLVVQLRYGAGSRYEELDELEVELFAVMDRPEVKKAILNLQAMDYFSSRMMGVLTALHRKFAETKRAIAICRVRPEPLKALRLCRLDKLIPIYVGEDEARHGLENG